MLNVRDFNYERYWLYELIRSDFSIGVSSLHRSKYLKNNFYNAYIYIFILFQNMIENQYIDLWLSTINN